jgi:cytochrome c peroxidase
MKRMAQAIASWERTVLAADSPFDRWRYGGQANALTDQQQDGFQLFVGKARCHLCHEVGIESALFMDQKFHDTGVGYQADQMARHRDSHVQVELAPGVVVSVPRQIVQQVAQVRPRDEGRFEVTHDPDDRWRFKTPTLRNVERTAPYMHDGSLRTLEEVVRFYNAGGIPHRGLDPLIEPLGLDDEEVASLVAFLRSLTAGNLSELIADARSVPVGN